MHLSSLIYVDAKEGELPPSLATHPQNQQQLQNQQQPQEQKLGRLHRRLDRSCTCSNPLQDAEEILVELCTQSRNCCSSAASSVIQYGIVLLSRRALTIRCSIQ